MRKAIFFTIIAAVLAASDLLAQNFSHKEIYDQDFAFTDGLYLSKDDLRNNRPIEKSQISSNLDHGDLIYFEQLTKNKTIAIFDKVGNEVEIEVAKLFGYCSDGEIYINCNGSFAKVGIIGAICHFVGTKTIYHYSPGPYMGFRTMNPYWTHNTASQEPQQYIYNFESGLMLEYNSENMKTMLMADPAIHDEYAALSKKKRNAQMFYYLRLYNEKHLLYIPVYE